MFWTRSLLSYLLAEAATSHNNILSLRHILLNNTTLRATDKLDELISLRTLGELSLSLIAACEVVELALEEDAASIVDGVDLLCCEATT